MAGGGGGAAQELLHGPERRRAFRRKVVVAGYHAQPQKDVGSHRAAAGLGVVENIPGPDHQRLVVAAGVVETANAVVPEQGDHAVGD